MQNRKTNGQYAHKTSGKAVVWLVAIMIAVGVLLYTLGDKTPTQATVEPEVAQVEQVAQLPSDVEAYMNSPEFKKEMELKARTDVLITKRKAEVQKNKENLATLKAEYDAKILDENDNNRTALAEIETKLADVRAEELEAGKTNAVQVKGN